MNKAERKLLLEIEEIVVVLSSFALIAAAFLPWGITENATVLGISGLDSRITIGVGVLAIILLAIKSIPDWISLLLGLIALGTGVIDYYAMLERAQELQGSVGIGLYLTIAASVGVIIGTVLDMMRKKK